jgi:hypothetical protein
MANRSSASAGIPMGSCVQLSEIGRLRCPTLVGRLGRVVGHSLSGNAARVAWNGPVAHLTIHNSYLEAFNEGVLPYEPSPARAEGRSFRRSSKHSGSR